MLSRVADSLFWLGRYGERLETNAQLIERQMEHILEHSVNDKTIELEWDSLLKICGYYDEFQSRYQNYDINTILYYLLFDSENLNSIESLIESVRFNLKNTRDILPSELWETWHDIRLLVNSFSTTEINIMELGPFLKQLRTYCLTTTGIVDSLMTRDESYMFLKIGKWLERSEKTSLICKILLKMKSENKYSFTADYTLLLTNTYDDYTHRYRNRTDISVLQFIMTDSTSTKSVNYAMNKIHKTILDLQQGQFKSYTDEIFKMLFDLRNLTKIDCVNYDLKERIEWVNKIHDECIKFGPVFSRTYYLTPPILVD